MLAFQILVNGEVVCTAGAPPSHRVLSTIVSWTHREPDQIGFHVGGVPDADQHLDWNVPEVGIGDEISIRIIDTDDVDQPDNARPKIDRPE